MISLESLSKWLIGKKGFLEGVSFLDSNVQVWPSIEKDTLPTWYSSYAIKSLKHALSPTFGNDNNKRKEESFSLLFSNLVIKMINFLLPGWWTYGRLTIRNQYHSLFSLVITSRNLYVISSNKLMTTKGNWILKNFQNIKVSITDIKTIMNEII